MKILVVNGSPKGAQGNTDILTQAFLAGAIESGAEVETIYLKDKTINHCIGCFTCWTKTPGVCVFKDDMAEILKKGEESDIIVYATPLYVYTVSGLMKDFMDRIIPIVQPFIDVKDGLCSHPRRNQNNKYWGVLISNSGFPEQAHFSGMKETFKRMYREDIPMICCAGGVLLSTPGIKDTFGWYIDAVKQAGREVIATGRISPETQTILDKPLMEDQELFANMVNANWKSMGIERIGDLVIEAEHTSASSVDATPLTAPTSLETVRDLVAGLTSTFNAEEAGDRHIVIQFDVPDEEPGHYFIEIDAGKCSAYAGTHPEPNMTINTPANVWLGIAKGELSGASAFMTGKYKLTGDMSILMQFEKLFPAPKSCN